MSKNVLYALLFFALGFVFRHFIPLFNNNSNQNQNQTSENQNGNYGENNRRYKHEQGDYNVNQNDNNNVSIETASAGEIPAKVMTVLNYVKQNHQAMEGYVGGRRFKNLEQELPKSTTDGQRINYQEWDVNPKIEGQNRGTERLITGDDNSAYYTNNHYQSFKKIQ